MFIENTDLSKDIFTLFNDSVKNYHNEKFSESIFILQHLNSLVPNNDNILVI